MAVVGLQVDDDCEQGLKKWARRARAFAVVNGTILTIGATVAKANENATAWKGVAAHVGRIWMFCAMISNSAAKKQPIGKKRQLAPGEKDFLGLIARTVVAGCGEFLVFHLCSRWLVQSKLKLDFGEGYISRFLLWYSRFVLKSFAFEIVFDYFHYWAHRVFHEFPGLYRFHKDHHKFLHPSPLSTYQQHPADIVLTNLVPSTIALWMVRSFLGIHFRTWEFCMLTSYKTFVEIGGHAGVETNATSFPQFPPLPKLVGIAMRTNDHDLHHSMPSRPCNYSKRFTLWDKVFKTYISPSET